MKLKQYNTCEGCKAKGLDSCRLGFKATVKGTHALLMKNKVFYVSPDTPCYKPTNASEFFEARRIILHSLKKRGLING